MQSTFNTVQYITIIFMQLVRTHLLGHGDIPHLHVGVKHYPLFTRRTNRAR
jgi:hypothetical protein